MEGHIETIGELNEIVRRGDFPLLVDREESRHVKRIIRMAERIAAHVPAIRLVLLAGPSSAGKTTTAIRLCTRLKENGLTALRLSTDDYFVGDARNPRDANGNLDYEHVDAVDRDRLVSDLAALFAGEAVHLRKFDFEKKDGFDDPNETTLAPRGVVILEGIHALNPLLTTGIPEEIKFRIYINIFTQPRADPCVAFFAEDIRLLRRIVRDANYRNESATATLLRWPSVEVGEQRWINPYRRLADAVFNTGLDYELAVLKPFARDMLRGVETEGPCAREAERLDAILATVAEASSDGVPGNSILRETIGGSHLVYD